MKSLNHACLVMLGILTVVAACQDLAMSRQGEKRVATDTSLAAGSNSARQLMSLQAPLAEAAQQIQKLDTQGASLGGSTAGIRGRTP